MNVIRIATRGSKLALAQAEIVKKLIEDKGINTEIVIVSTHGDRDQKSSLVKIGGNGLFVKEVEQVLLDGEADIAVHSGKDLPYDLLPGLTIAGIPKAADSRDCMIVPKGHEGAIRVIGTGSPRRVTQCGEMYPEAECQSIRGNVDTRLRKLAEGQYDAIMLAKAGLDRLDLDLTAYDVNVLECEEFIPSACQGIIAVECREDDSDTVNVLKEISDDISAKRFTVERYMMRLLEADCKLPVAVHSHIEGDELTVYAMFNGKKTKAHSKAADYKAICEEIKKEIYN